MNMIVIIGALELGGIFAIMSLGLYLSYKILNLPDLTVDGSFTLGCAVSAVLTLSGHPYLALCAAFIEGMLAGLVTGLLTTKLKIASLLAGILTMTGLYSINLKIMNDSPNILCLIVQQCLHPYLLLESMAFFCSLQLSLLL